MAGLGADRVAAPAAFDLRDPESEFHRQALPLGLVGDHRGDGGAIAGRWLEGALVRQRAERLGHARAIIPEVLGGRLMDVGVCGAPRSQRRADARQKDARRRPDLSGLPL